MASSLTIVAAQEAHSAVLATTGDEEFSQTTATGTVGNSQTWTYSFYAKASANSIARVRACFQPLVSAGTANGSEITGTQTNVTTQWQRFSVSGATPASLTSRAEVIMRFQNSAATTVTVYLRNAKFEQASSATPFVVGDETVSMVPTDTGFARVLPIYNPSEAPAPCSFTITAPDAASAVTDIYMALRSSRRRTGDGALTDFLNGPFYARCDATANGWTVALGTGTTDGGTYASVNHATDPTVYNKRVTLTRTTKLDALRGEHDVWARVQAVAAEKFYLQLRWGPNGGTPAPYTLPEVTHDVTAATAFGWVMVNLGRIRLPRETSVTLGTLTLELWTHTGTADQDLRIEYLHFMPVDQQAHIEAPGGATVSWLGRELVSPVTNPAGGTAGTVDGDHLELDTATDNAGTSPAAGSIIEAGRHRSTFILGNQGATKTAVIRVRNITDTTTTKTSTVSVVGNVSSQVFALTWTAASAKTYQLQVDDPSSGTTGSHVYIQSIEDEFIPSVVQNEKVRTDPGSVPGRYAVEKLNSSGVLMSDFAATTVPFVLPPGLSLVNFEVLDGSLADYTEPQSVDARTITVAPTIYPRYPV